MNQLSPSPERPHFELERRDSRQSESTSEIRHSATNFGISALSGARLILLFGTLPSSVLCYDLLQLHIKQIGRSDCLLFQIFCFLCGQDSLQLRFLICVFEIFCWRLSSRKLDNIATNLLPPDGRSTRYLDRRSECVAPVSSLWRCCLRADGFWGLEKRTIYTMAWKGVWEGYVLTRRVDASRV